VHYFEIKTLDVEMIDIERSEGVMSHRRFAATPWEVEAERRGEVLRASALAGRSARERGTVSVAMSRGRRWLASLRGSTDAPPAQAGRLNQKRV